MDSDIGDAARWEAQLAEADASEMPDVTAALRALPTASRRAAQNALTASRPDLAEGSAGLDVTDVDRGDLRP